MRVMVLVRSTIDSEAGVMPSAELLASMGSIMRHWRKLELYGMEVAYGRHALVHGCVLIGFHAPS